MQENEVDEDVMQRIQQLVDEEGALYNGNRVDGLGLLRLEVIRIELDRCWDLVRQRRALARIGQDPSLARVRDAAVVAHYQG